LTIPTSDSGLKIAEHLSFSLEREGNMRKDGFDIYSKEFIFSDLSEKIRQNNKLFSRFDASAYANTAKKLN
jgi:hypothetical protein